MKKILILLLVVVPIVGLLVLAGLGWFWWTTDSRPGPEAPDPSSERRVTEGAVRGFDAGNGAQGWLGIPYAAPPVNALRWRAPQPATPWAGTRDALVAGPPCPQLGGPLSDVPRNTYNDVVGEEDCLTLNVWAPNHTRAELDGLAEPYPVMVWIHGGGNTIGYGADYDGSNLAATEDVIVVTFNYRLGVLGWFNHPAITAGAASEADASGNFGTLDTIAVLRWVQDNIGAFGGDRNRVTIFGESAGGVNVYALLASPLAEGLFHGAIVQSGLARASTVREARNFVENGGHTASAREVVSRWLVEQGRAEDRASADEQQRALGAGEIRNFLQDLDPVALLDGFFGPGGMYPAPAVFLDGHVLPNRPLLEALADERVGSAVPVIAGTNRDEAKLFMATDGRYVERRWGLSLHIRDPQTYEAVAGILSDHWRLVGVDQPLDALSRVRPRGTWAYRFDWDESDSNAIADMPRVMGAAHGFELPFVFGDFSDLWGIPLLFTDDNEAGRLELSRAMMAYWGAFARSGAPRVEGLPAWPTWGQEAEGRVLVLDTLADGGIRPADQRIVLENLRDRLVDVAPALNDSLACSLYAYLFWNTGAWQADSYRSLNSECNEVTPQVRAANPFS
ncbi:MAG: carboxylesterase family protein [Xanthomonadales bacterium]|jgi:para-nitrobenzyl esterase|nr:carboxylesterase family protein [Xanthomonadales bacterium]